MGLDTTHGAFSGAYSSFNRFRQAIAKAAGGSYPPHEAPLVIDDETFAKPDQGRVYIPGTWAEFQKERPGLAAFLISNDCEGEFPPDLCKQMADEIEALLPVLEALSLPEAGHIARDGGFVEVAKRYIAGCREAHAAGETLEYH